MPGFRFQLCNEGFVSAAIMAKEVSGVQQTTHWVNTAFRLEYNFPLGIHLWLIQERWGTR
jgi:hypothetical protein